MFYIIKQIGRNGAVMRLLSRAEEYVLLAVWRLEGNAYTLSILDQISKVTGYKWQIGAIYVPLEKLRKKKYLKKIKGDPTPERGGRSKFLYELTDAGKRALKEIKEVQEAAWAGVFKVNLDRGK
jgi:PadR family transcriptional regulator PadR